jgi:hypothetical protein
MLPIIEEAYARVNAKLPTGWILNVDRKRYSPAIPCISISLIDDPTVEIPLSVDMASLYESTAGEAGATRANLIADAIITNALEIVLAAFNNVVKVKQYAYTSYFTGEKIGPLTVMSDPMERLREATVLSEKLEFTSDIPWYHNDIDNALPAGWEVDRTFDNVARPTQFALYAASGKHAGAKIVIETRSVMFPDDHELAKRAKESRREYVIRLALDAVERLSPPEGL